MLDPEAPIEPGRGLGGIALGCTVAEILATATPLRVIELPGSDDAPDGVTIHSFGAIRTWSVAGRVEQVGAFEGYQGRTASGIGLGSTIADIRAASGEVVATGTEGMIVLPGTPGVGMETSEWTTGDQPDPAARVIQIFVHASDG
ncbi:MAG: hypothetical protein ACYSX0_11090 [Planctomycetota bacterium]|jgi:hypothetical protein